MDFQDFLELVTKLPAIVLPASEAHYKMAPLERIQSMKSLNITSLNPKPASVLMLIYPKSQKTNLVLIVRNSYEGVHSGQIAFPGGKFESADENFKNTALRETYEEIGVHPDRINIVMPFTNLYVPPSNFMVYPFLGICKEDIVFIPNSKEVVNIIELPLNDVLNDELIVSTTISTSYAENIEVPAFKIQGHIVWGATAMILSELKEVLKKVL